MAFRSFGNIADKFDLGGRFHSSEFRKSSNITTTAGIWADLSMFSGHPVTNFYASSPLVGATLLAREGIQHGPNVSTDQKYFKLASLTAASVCPITFKMLDYLLYYPFIDGDTTDEQTFDNTVTLPRYTTGEGVRAFLVAQGVYSGGQKFTLNYTNSDGVAGRISIATNVNTAGNTATIANSGVSAGNFGWSIPLAYGDKGIRSVEGITFFGAIGGIFALVLAYPINTTICLENNITSEREFFIDSAFGGGRIYDGAYLNYICLPNGSLASILVNGFQEFIWG
jgi:hypothetical protein